MKNLKNNTMFIFLMVPTISAAVGFTINHIAAVVLPALGGVLWLIDYRIHFLTGAAFSVISLIAVQQIHIKRRPL